MSRSTGPTTGRLRSNHSIEVQGTVTPHRTTRNWAALVASLALVGASCGADAADDTAGDKVAPVVESSDVVAETAVTPPAPSTIAGTVAEATSTTTTLEAPLPAWRSVDLVDASRPSKEILDDAGNVRTEGSDSRSIPTIILYPGTDGGGLDAPVADSPPRPLVIYLKGFGGLNSATDPLLVTLAEAGYIVAVPNIREVSDPINHFPGHVEQPGDARFVIDALTNPNDGFVDDLAPVIDSARIGLVGHSLGTAGAFGLAYHDCCRDDRVDAVVAFGGNFNNFDLGDTDFEFTGTPLLLIYGTNDDISPIEIGAEVLDLADPPSHLLALPGADHFQPVYGDAEGGDGDRAATTAATIGIGFLDLHVAGTTSQEDFDDLTASLEPGTWRNAGG